MAEASQPQLAARRRRHESLDEIVDGRVGRRAEQHAALARNELTHELDDRRRLACNRRVKAREPSARAHCRQAHRCRAGRE